MEDDHAFAERHDEDPEDGTLTAPREPRPVQRREVFAAGATGLALGLAAGMVLGATVIASRVAQPPQDADLKAAVDALTEKVGKMDAVGAGGVRSAPTSSTARTSQATSSAPARRPEELTSPKTTPREPSDPPKATPQANAGAREPTGTTTENGASGEARQAVVREEWVNLLAQAGTGDWESEPFALKDEKVRVFYNLSSTDRNSSGSVHLVPTGEQISEANKLPIESPTGYVNLTKPRAGAGTYTLAVRITGGFSVRVDQVK